MAVHPGITYSYYVESVAPNGLTSAPSNTVEELRRAFHKRDIDMTNRGMFIHP
jgi:hypothetical protein